MLPGKELLLLLSSITDALRAVVWMAVLMLGALFVGSVFSTTIFLPRIDADLAQVGWDEALLEEIDAVMGFIAGNLVDDGRILHHWMNGMMAQPEDPYDYCLGCNLQSLYILQLVGDATVTPPPQD